MRSAPICRGGHEQLIELDVIVTVRARNGRAPCEIVLDERTDHGLLKTPLEIDDVVWNTKVLGDTARVADIVERTAPLAAGFLRLAALRRRLRQAALIPELHGQADDGCAGLLQDRGHCGTIDAAAHGYDGQA